MKNATENQTAKKKWSEDLIKRYAIALMIILSGLNCCYFFLPGDPAKVVTFAIGRLVGPFIWSGFMVLFLQLFNRFRNKRSRWLIVLCVNAVLCISEFVLITQRVMGVVEFYAG